jgi:hypothetical protein
LLGCKAEAEERVAAVGMEEEAWAEAATAAAEMALVVAARAAEESAGAATGVEALVAALVVGPTVVVGRAADGVRSSRRRGSCGRSCSTR